VRDLYLAALDIEIGFHKANQQSTEQYSADDMARHLIKVYGGQMFGVGQTASFDFKGQNLKAVIRGMQVLDLSHNSANNVGATMGILVEETDVTFMKAADSHIKLKASAKK
jgi:vesicle-fusing ATPase